MKELFIKTLKNIASAIPVIFGVLLLVNLINPMLGDVYTKIFTGNYIVDPIIGALAGSISFGIPITSYVVGGELLSGGVSLLAVAAFIMTWTTVGVVMLPLEGKYLGHRFAVARNVVNFLFSILIAVITVSIMNLFNL